MSYSQKDMFGNWVTITEDVKLDRKRGPEPLRVRFRRTNGYVESDKQCKDCENFREYEYKGKKYFKCAAMGLSHSESTDIRKSDKPCKLFDERKKSHG